MDENERREQQRREEMSRWAGGMGAAPPPGADMAAFYQGQANRPQPAYKPPEFVPLFKPSTPVMPTFDFPTSNSSQRRNSGSVSAGRGSSSRSGRKKWRLLFILIALYYFGRAWLKDRTQPGVTPAPTFTPAPEPAPAQEESDPVYENPAPDGIHMEHDAGQAEPIPQASDAPPEPPPQPSEAPPEPPGIPRSLYPN